MIPHILQFFEYEHLPEVLQLISKPFHAMAHMLATCLPENPERATALRKLLEAKDCAVQSKLSREEGVQ